MKQTVIKLAVFLFSVGVFVFCIRNEGIAVTEDSTNSVNLQGTVNQSMELTKAIMASRSFGLAGAEDIDLGTYGAAGGGFTPGADFAGDVNTRFKNFFDGNQGNACIAISTGFEWEHMGQGDGNELLSFRGTASTANVGIGIGTHNMNSGTLADPLGDTSVGSYTDCSSSSVSFNLSDSWNGAVSAVGTAGIFLRNATGQIMYRTDNLSVVGVRTHEIQVMIQVL